MNRQVQAVTSSALVPAADVRLEVDAEAFVVVLLSAL